MPQRYKLKPSNKVIENVLLQQVYDVEVDDDEIEYQRIYVYRGLVVHIKVKFVDNSREYRNGLKVSLHRKYRDIKEVFDSKSDMFRQSSGSVWKIKRQGTDVYIHQPNGGSILHYFHYGLFKDYYNEKRNKNRFKNVDVDL